MITLYLSAIAAVCLNCAGSMIPMPFEFGQISLLISFICHVWCVLPSVGPFWSTMFVHCVTWSRQ